MTRDVGIQSTPVELSSGSPSPTSTLLVAETLQLKQLGIEAWESNKEVCSPSLPAYSVEILAHVMNFRYLRTSLGILQLHLDRVSKFSRFFLSLPSWTERSLTFYVKCYIVIRLDDYGQIGWFLPPWWAHAIYLFCFKRWLFALFFLIYKKDASHSSFLEHSTNYSCNLTCDPPTTGPKISRCIR